MKSFQTLLFTLVISACLLATTGANATLVPALGGQVINDTDLNITWLADANLPATNLFGLSNDSSQGNMYWNSAQLWIGAMNAANYLGYNNWRLPTAGPVNGSTFNYQFGYNPGYNGTVDIGYNISAQGTAYAGSTGSEMAHLYYNSLNNKSDCDPITSTALTCDPQTGGGMINSGPFINFQRSGFAYWSGTEFAPDTRNAVSFSMMYGGQSPSNKNNVFFVMVVRDGQVATVPAPAAAWLLSSGLLGLLGVARRKAA